MTLPTATRATLKQLAAGPRRAGWHVLADLALIAGIGAAGHGLLAALPAIHPVLDGLVAGGVLLGTAFAIGFGPLHDVLVQGHDATHGLAAKNRRWNAFWLWFCHALVGISGRAYRAFHLDHHRETHTPDDPEAWFYDPANGRPGGWDCLRLTWATHPVVNTWRTRHTKVRRRDIAVDLLGMVALHALLVGVFGLWLWATLLVLPVFTGLAVAVVLRALTEHHGAIADDPLKNTRWTRAHRALQWLWTNVDHHLEHHLAPWVPADRLPAVRAAITPVLEAQGRTPDEGLLRTAAQLLVEPVHFGMEHGDEDHFAPFVTRDLGHALKVRWLRDILKNGPARRHLWTLYFHGEAYEDLHPLGVWIDRLAPRWGRKLRRQFDDENRHAVLFTDLLAAENALPYPVEGPEDVGWTQLHHCVPDVCEAAGREAPFTEEQTMRYLGFLHALETRSITDLTALRDAAVLEDRPDVVQTVTTILADERVHATWTWRALCELAGDPARAHAVYAPIHAAERVGTERILRHLLVAFEDKGAAPTGLRGRLRWQLMAAAARFGLAIPLLPTLPFHHRPKTEVTRAA
jgi:fatty acid desaturase